VKNRKKLNHRATGESADQLMEALLTRVVGQDTAIREIVNVYQRHIAGMGDPMRPAGNLLLLGPTGTGKTRSVEALAECLVNNPRAVIKIDCAEYQHSHEIAKLIGSPPGYLGHRETQPLLSQEALNQHHTEEVKLSVVLFDEIEKANIALWNLLLGILDKATLTLGDNRKVDFSKALVFCTGNTGSREIASNLQPSMGFSVPHVPDSTKLRGKIDKIARGAAWKHFTPEFLNRFDAIVSFSPLSENDMAKILDLEIGIVTDRTSTLTFSVTDSAKRFLLKEGTADPRTGARGIKRVVERRIAGSIANIIVSGQSNPEDHIEIDASEEADDLAFYAVKTAARIAAASPTAQGRV
jgi:ATP-dependent Clp protease ATP-binding subunit ClpB